MVKEFCVHSSQESLCSRRRPNFFTTGTAGLSETACAAPSPQGDTGASATPGGSHLAIETVNFFVLRPNRSHPQKET